MDVALVVAEKGNQNSITDAAVSALMANAGVQSAILNVEINLGSIKDEAFVNKISNEVEELKKKSKKKTDEIMEIVYKNLNR